MPKKNNNGINIKTLKLLAGLLLLIGILSYGAYEARHLIAGPILTLTDPENGSLSLDDVVHIQGNAQNISFISLNDREITIDEEGYFSKEVVLSPGYNPVKLYARDRFGRETVSLVELLYKDTRGVNISQLINTETQNDKKN